MKDRRRKPLKPRPLYRFRPTNNREGLTMNDATLVTNTAACLNCGTPAAAPCGCHPAPDTPAPTYNNFFGLPGAPPAGCATSDLPAPLATPD